MRLFKQVAIVGIGLIGGSIALGLKKNELSQEVIGVSRSRKTVLLAKKRKAIDKGSQNIKIIKDADLLILATPVNVTLKLAPLISKIIKKDCIVIDVCSTKALVVSSLEKFFANYIGTHPLAGSEKRGIAAACPGLFEKSICILTPTKNTKPQVMVKAKKMWLKLGAQIVVLPADVHDRILSFVSHLPHIIASSLIRCIPKSYLKLAPSSLKDTSRIAASDSELWSDIFLSNKENIIHSIEVFQRLLRRLKVSLQKEDRRLLTRILTEAKKTREQLG